MKTTKVMTTLVVALIFVFFSSNLFAQTYAEIQNNLTTDHQSVMKHTNAIASGEAKNVNDQIMHYNEARRSFADAKKLHTQLKKTIPKKYLSTAIIYHDKIDKQHIIATALANLMAAELKSNNPDNDRLKELAKKIYDATAIAEKEHLELIKDMK
jgi:endonuclease IV